MLAPASDGGTEGGGEKGGGVAAPPLAGESRDDCVQIVTVSVFEQAHRLTANAASALAGARRADGFADFARALMPDG